MASQRKVVFIENEIYHIFNRGVERRSIFSSEYDYQRFYNTLYFYLYPTTMRFSHFNTLSATLKNKTRLEMSQKEKEITLIAFCLMPNHFHLLIKQKQKNLSLIISKLTNSYTKYFNEKHNRVGPLFQGNFKAVRVESDDQLLHLSRYIHLNPIKSAIISENQLTAFRWSSFREYREKIDGICEKDLILSQFKTQEQYKDFVLASKYEKGQEVINHLTLEEHV